MHRGNTSRLPRTRRCSWREMSLHRSAAGAPAAVCPGTLPSALSEYALSSSAALPAAKMPGAAALRKSGQTSAPPVPLLSQKASCQKLGALTSTPGSAGPASCPCDTYKESLACKSAIQHAQIGINSAKQAPCTAVWRSTGRLMLFQPTEYY